LDTGYVSQKYKDWLSVSANGCYLVLCPDPLLPRPSHTCEEGLVFWATYLVTWGGANLGFEITNQNAEDLITIALRK